jgi:hypothetical protein
VITWKLYHPNVALEFLDILSFFSFSLGLFSSMNLAPWKPLSQKHF